MLGVCEVQGRRSGSPHPLRYVIEDTQPCTLSQFGNAEILICTNPGDDLSISTTRKGGKRNEVSLRFR